MKGSTSRKWWVSLSLVALVAAGGAWLLTPSPSAPSVGDAGPTPSTAKASLGSWGADPRGGLPGPEDDDAVHDDLAEVQGTGRTTPVVDQAAQDARDAQAYRQRIDDNIASLELAAEVALQQGLPERAALMEKRISGLERRLSEFEDDQAAPVATPG